MISDSGPPAASPIAGKKLIVVGAGLAGLAFVISLSSLADEPREGMEPPLSEEESNSLL
jgi:hypothetical protein